MREIKFRVWDIKNNMMYFPNETENMFLSLGNDYFEIQDHSTENYQANSNDLAIVNTLDDDLVLMQFTGLKDNNGKEIYEGDIIKVNGETEKYYDDNLFEPPETVEFELITEVFYNDLISSFDLQTIEPDLDMKSWGFYGEGTENHLEVIGNIHENPELL